MLYTKEKRGSTIVYIDKEICIKGEYLKLATISEGGNVEWYVDTSALPKDMVEEVANEAKGVQERFQRAFNRLPKMEQLHKAVSICPCWLYFELFENNRCTDKDRLSIAKEYYFSKV